MSPSRRPGRRAASLVGAALLSGAAVLTVTGTASAATSSVEVRDDEYAPAAIEIVAGDTVRWTWTGESPHSVTAPGLFDSHPRCTRLTTDECGTAGAAFSWTSGEPMTVEYGCRIHPDRMRGTITVVAAADPPPASPPASPSPSPSPSARPSPSPPASPPLSPSPSPTAASPAPAASPSPSPSPRPTRRSAPSLGFGRATEVPASPREDTDGPAVAPPVVSDGSTEPLEPFPAPPSPSPSPDPVADDVVAVGTPGGSGRDAVRLAGAATVALSVLAFGRIVLFGRSWE